MVSTEDNWIRIFDISEISKHNKGFTIYKIISMLYPRNCPDSITKVTVWKRYNDFKKLHRDIKIQHKLLKIKDKCPVLPSTSYFRRFDEDVICQRRVNILKFLEFLAAHPQLFTLDVCVQFFKSSYTPCELLNSNIHSIRAELHLPIEPDYNLIWSHSDDEHTISDSESILTLSSMMENLPDPINPTTNSDRMKIKSDISLTNSFTSSYDSLNMTPLEASTNIDGLVFLTPPQTPISLSPVGPNYVFEALQYITRAIELELGKNYEGSFAAYKAGIDILLKNVRDDKDFNRKQMIRHKVEKYLLRAEKIYNMYLSAESKTLKNYSLEHDEEEKEIIQDTVSDLYKYKVIKVIASGMLVLHSDSQQLFYIKVIHKTSMFANDKLILPGNVPYMVKLYNYYNCENALFLVLQYCSGTNLSDYIKQKVTNSETIFNMSFYTMATAESFAIDEDCCSDEGSDHSYSDLVQDYSSKRYERQNSRNKSLALSNQASIEEEPNCIENIRNGCEQLESLGEVNHLVVKSQELISSIDTVLHNNLQLENYLPQINGAEKLETHRKSSRKSSERSEWSLFDDFHFTKNTLLLIQDVTKWAAQLLLALERLHLFGVICRTLDTNNVIIDECGDLMLTYMCNVSEKYDLVLNDGDNQVHFAPELRTFNPISDAVDWWSYGAILYEMLVGVPLKLVHPEGVNSYTILKIPKYVSVEGRSLLKQLLVYEPLERLGYGTNGAEDIKSHPFFNTVLWDALVKRKL